ncbi:dipeptide epimerase [Glaciecola sp. 1036]|uniref:dipeptide epimerase n=1 Tax=Alteromonadaceae TaxID=72275 RepID=UPI003CFED943
MTENTITRISLHSLTVPLKTPFRTAVREVNAIEDLVVVIELASGLCGIGSTPSTPQITGQDHASVIQEIIELSAELLNKKVSVKSPETLLNGFTSIGVNTKCALEIALYDIAAKLEGKPLFRYLNGDFSLDNQLTTDITISANALDKMLVDTNTAFSDGYRCFKIKTGKYIEQDKDNLFALHEHLKSLDQDCQIRIDANQGWTVDESIDVMQALESAGCQFELLEQPVKAEDIQGLKTIKTKIKTPVMADESAFSLAQVKHLVEQQAVDIINIKLVKTGGLSEAIKIAEYCRQNKVVCMMGCMLEGSIGVAAAAHFSKSQQETIRFIDLDGPTLGKYDPIHATLFENAKIVLNRTPGLGIPTTKILSNTLYSFEA